MKSVSCFHLCLITALLTGSAIGQGLNRPAAELIAGNANERGATYRFSNFFTDTDAVITVEHLNNLELQSMQDPGSRALEHMNPKAIENAAWSPVFAGTGGDGLHYADFTVSLFANGTNTAQAPKAFSTSFFGSDLSDTSGGFMIEFVQVTNASRMLTDEDLATLLGEGDQPLAAWAFDGVTEYGIRIGWQGDNGPSEGKTFDALASRLSETTISSDLGSDPLASSTTTVPEPSSSLLFVLSMLPAVFLRKRKKNPSK